ncbi:Glycosyl transferase 2 family protein [Serratia symbiotica]|nr:Glycosyl transferase 2 family protein [Serratia symbiotica]
MILNNIILSIIITTQNCETYIEKTLSTLLNSLSSLKNGYEIILINDTSIDKTTKILKKFTKNHINFTYLFQVNFKNIGKVRNFAIKKCSGNYITMIDGDDLLVKDALYDIIKFLIIFKPDLLLTKLYEIYKRNKINISWNNLNLKYLSQSQTIKKFLIHKDIQAHFIGQFIKRKILIKHPFPTFCCYEDSYLFPIILIHCYSIYYSYNSYYLYFKHKNSLSNKINYKKIKLLIIATQKMENIFNKKYHNLISCHWINIFERYNKKIYNTIYYPMIIKKINKINYISFLLDPSIRLSFKKKYLKIKKWKII